MIRYEVLSSICLPWSNLDFNICNSGCRFIRDTEQLVHARGDTKLQQLLLAWSKHNKVFIADYVLRLDGNELYTGWHQESFGNGAQPESTLAEVSMESQRRRPRADKCFRSALRLNRTSGWRCVNGGKMCLLVVSSSFTIGISARRHIIYVISAYCQCYVRLHSSMLIVPSYR